MKTITRRQLSRKPSLISSVKPGESVHVPDRKGGLVLTHAKKNPLTPQEMLSELQAISQGCPAMDTNTCLVKGE